MKRCSRTILLSLTVLTLGSTAARAAAPIKTTLLKSGPKGKKFNLVIVGEGFTNGNQAAFDTYATNTVLAQAMTEGPVGESLNAFNIIKVNVDSNEAGITQVDNNGNPRKDAMGNVISVKDTAFKIGDAGKGGWAACWYRARAGFNSSALINSTLKNVVPERTYTIIVINSAITANGCRRNDEMYVDLGTSANVIAHELGHLIGNLGDEYVNRAKANSEDGAGPNTCNNAIDDGGDGVANGWDTDCWVAGNYTGGEPKEVNLTKNTNRATLKWAQFVNPATAIPTVRGMGINDNETAGVFRGAKGVFATGIFKPVYNGRMFSNAPRTFGPVEYDAMKMSMHKWHDHSFDKKYVGDFDGDGRSDLVVHNGTTLELFLSDGTNLVPTWKQTWWNPATGVPNDWEAFARNDQFFVGDFDNDGADDLFAFNGTDFLPTRFFGMLRWDGTRFVTVKRFDNTLPGWTMREHDKFFVADFDGVDGDDLYVFNGDDWAIGILGMLKSTGTDLQMVKRYNKVLPGWDLMKSNDKFFVANVDGTVGQDLYVSNFGDWDRGYFMAMKSTGTELVDLQRYDGELPGWDDILGHDQYFPADFDGDGDDDIYAFNGDEWGKPYLGVLRNANGVLDLPFQYEDNVPGWGTLGKNDQFVVANVNGDNRKDLYGFNGTDFGSNKYLGFITASDTGLAGGWTKNKVSAPAPVQPGAANWPFIGNENLVVGDFDGPPVMGPARDDVMVTAKTKFFGLTTVHWLAVLRGDGGTFTPMAVYPNWIHDHLFHSQGWW